MRVPQEVHGREQKKSKSRGDAITLLADLCSPSNCCVSDSGSSRDRTCCPLVSRGQPRPAQNSSDEVPLGPLLFPPRGHKGIASEVRESRDPYHVSSFSSVVSTTARSAEQENDWKDVNEVECWRRNNHQQRVRAAAVRDSIKRLAEDGSQKGIVVDLRTGQRSDAFYWIREDARVLCVLQKSCSKLEVLPCAAMEIISRADLSKDVAARQFFLGLDEAELRRAVLIVMLAAHGQVVPAPLLHHHIPLPPTRVRCLLICADRNRRRLLLEGLKTFQAELLVHSPSSQGPDATTRGFDEEGDDGRVDLATTRSVLSDNGACDDDAAQSFEAYLQNFAAQIDRLNWDKFGLVGSDDSVADSRPSCDQDESIQSQFHAMSQDIARTDGIRCRADEVEDLLKQ